MDNLAGLGAALAAMSTDDGRRYDGSVMLSALPDAPTIDRPRFIDRVRRLLPRRSRVRVSTAAVGSGVRAFGLAGPRAGSQPLRSAPCSLRGVRFGLRPDSSGRP